MPHTTKEAPAQQAPDKPRTGRHWPKKTTSKWNKKTGYKYPQHFRRPMILAFEEYIRASDLPTAGRLMLAAMVCTLAPTHNPQFARDRFLEGCGLDPTLTDDALIEAHTDLVRRLAAQ